MPDRNGTSRRTVLKLSGTAATAALTGLAGCSGGGGGGEETTTTAGDGGGEETTTTTDEGGVAGSFKLGGKVTGWIGISPDRIDGTENPTLNLTAGETYEVTWVNKDGVIHDFQTLDADGTVLKQTTSISKRGKSTTLTFTATTEMTTYRCSYHPTTMKGSLKVE